ncbi:class I adenylate-forming enzyme family protein [Ureibacillus manganicus]|uniref:AMP-dependent synthetase n=1 Tax=Ureibacillus manganicus DSM 26584 TaxID=1384049 RepID=A0A0A3I5E1_9BACL|nr:long-chain fatty acid--CoA ligase [Ureibacillus manganicus]KGR77893.1 AMP-dependent synthetase [Ureibacillus manganicus DSM 26584]
MLVSNMLKQYATTKADKIASQFKNKTLTYKELYMQAERLASYLQSKGYKKGDIAAIYMNNSDMFLVCYFGVQLLGMAAMPINTKLAVPEVQYILNHSEAKVLIADQALYTNAEATGYEFEEVIINEKSLQKIVEDASLNEKFVTVEVKPDEMAVVMYTSGTTGKPKGVMLSQRNLYETGRIWSESMEMNEHDRMFICTPLFHCAASHVFAVPILYSGGTIVIEEAFSPDKTLQQLVETEATIFFGVPAMYTILLNRPNTKSLSFPKLRLFTYGAAPMPYEILRQLKEAFPQVRVQNLYGQTENTPAASSLLDDQALLKIGSVGKPLVRTEVQVVDTEGVPVPLGEVGEIVVKGPQVMIGYLKNPEETARTIKDGWLYSGDLGRFDEEGYLYIVDRKKDMIIRGGENVYPVEIEDVIYQIPEILETAVVGIPHEVYGEVPKVFVVLKEGKTLDADEIINYCVKNLAKYKVPAEVEFIDVLPRNASGKVLKHLLKVQHVV